MKEGESAKRLMPRDVFLGGYKALIRAGYAFVGSTRLLNQVYSMTMRRERQTIMLYCAARDNEDFDPNLHVGTVSLNSLLTRLVGCDVSDVDAIYIPLAQVNQRAHWTLLVVYPKRHQVHFYDPSPAWPSYLCPINLSRFGLGIWGGYSLSPMLKMLDDHGFHLEQKTYTAIQPVTNRVACGYVVLYMLESLAAQDEFDNAISMNDLMESSACGLTMPIPEPVMRASDPYPAVRETQVAVQESDGEWTLT